MKVTSIFTSLLFLMAYASAVMLPDSKVTREAAILTNTTDCTISVTPVQLLRSYNPTVVDHFYTISPVQITDGYPQGYFAQGVTGWVFPSQVSGTLPLYRLYTTTGTDHFYTTDTVERDFAISNLGYHLEDTEAFVYPIQVCGAQPLYRLYNPSGIDHFYTMSAAERDSAVANLGYDYEFIGAYIFPA